MFDPPRLWRLSPQRCGDQMKQDKKCNDSSKMFDRLVRNALTFLERSAEAPAQCLAIQCPSCGAHVLKLAPILTPNSESHCNLCSRSITLTDILDLYAPRSNSAAGVVEENRAFCGNTSCVQDSQQESAVLFGNKWACLHCFEVANDVWTCKRCERRFIGEWEGPLCTVCEYADEWPSTSGGVM